MTDNGPAGELLIRTDPGQLNAVITQVSKAFEVSQLPAEDAANDRLLTIMPRQPSTTLPCISVLYFVSTDTGRMVKKRHLEQNGAIASSGR